MTTGHDIVGAALREISSYAPGEGIEGGDSEHALGVLNRMLKAWAAEELITPWRTLEAFALTPGTPSYLIGTGQTWATPRPDDVTAAFVRDAAGTDTPLEIRSSGYYNGIADKNAQGTPVDLYYDQQWPYGRVYLHPTGLTGQTLYLESRKPLNQFTTLNTDLDMPDEYEEHVVYQLAERLAPAYGYSLTPEQVKIKNDAEDRIMRARAKGADAELDPALTIPRNCMTFSR